MKRKLIGLGGGLVLIPARTTRSAPKPHRMSVTREIVCDAADLCENGAPEERALE